MTVEYKFNNGACVPIRVHTVVMSAQHKAFDGDLEVLRKDLREKVIEAVIPAHLLDDKTIYYLNPCGNFQIDAKTGHFKALSILVARKVMPVSLAAKSSWTPTEAGALTEAALFPAKIPPKWTVPVLMALAGWPSLW